MKTVSTSIRTRLFPWLGRIAASALCLIAILWAFGAAYFDGPSTYLAAAQLVAMLLVFVFVGPWWRKLAVVAVWFTVVLGWWWTLKPSHDRQWQPDVAETGWAEIHGDEVTLHNIRNFDYRTATDSTPHWETRTVRLSQMTGIDLAICYWGSPYMAHPIVSFQFADSPPVCFSIETRKEIGETYSAIGGLFRRYELTYIMADERDVIRLRTNYRKGEDVYLYRLNGSPEIARGRFMEYLTTLNALHDQPHWYNAITTNCTTAIRTQHHAANRAPWDWRILVNGLGDEMMFERGLLNAGGLPFQQLKAAARINDAAQAHDSDEDFSRLIRKGRPGFPKGPSGT